VNRWRGLKDLVVDAVHHGTRAIEEVQATSTRRVYDLVGRVPPLAQPARWVRGAHEGLTAGAYVAIRAVNRAAGRLVDLALDVAEAARAESARSGRRRAARAPKARRR
jgi:hypothetical protein